MQNSEKNYAIKVLSDVGPYLNKTKLAVKCECHPNTVENYMKGKWSDHNLGLQMTKEAVNQFILFKTKVNAVSIPSQFLK